MGLWFTETGSHTGGEGIGLIDQEGSMREFELPAGTRPFGIAKGAEGSAWFTEVGSHWGIGQVTLAGDITEFPVDLHNAPLNIVAGPDGAMWFTEDGIVNGGSGAIGRITPTGELTEYILPTLPGYSSGAGDITVGPDGNLWFTWAAQRSTKTWTPSCRASDGSRRPASSPSSRSRSIRGGRQAVSHEAVTATSGSHTAGGTRSCGSP